MRILHIVGDSRFGGAGRIILGLGHMAKSEGWDVDILTTDPMFQLAARRNGLGVLDLDVIRRPIRPHWDLRGLLKLRSALKRDSYGIVHTHTSKAGFVGRLAASMAGVPIIIHTMHGLAFHERSARSIRLFYSILERFAAKRCDRVVSVSEFHRRWAIDLGICNGSKILTIPNGIVDQSLAITAPLELRRRLGVSRKDLMILTMARLVPDKGLEYLIEAAAQLRLAAPHCKTVIAGDGPARLQLERLACKLDVSDRVTFLGHRQDVDALLAACDIVALPSLREGLSISLLEAMAASKPIVASRIGSHLEVASQANIAKLVTPADARALSDTLLDLSRDPEMMVTLGTNARRLYELRYTDGRMLNAYRELYHSLLGANSTATSSHARQGEQNRTTYQAP
jgi:glycosyltransferase involved in cell wall biosynthesis